MNTRALAVAVLLTTTTACARPIVRRLGEAAVRPDGSRAPNRACTLRVETPVDARPPELRDPGDQTTGPFVPIMLIVWWKKSAGPVYARAENLGGPELLAELGEGFSRSLSALGPCAVVSGDASFVLRSEVAQLHGVSYEKSTFVASAAMASRTHFEFYPAGQVTIGFTLARASGEEVARFTLSEGHLFDPDLEGSTTAYSAEGLTGATIENNRTNEVMAALGKLLARLPGEVERALVARRAVPPVAHTAETFFVDKQLADYEHVERAEIDMETGEVLEAAIERRRDPVSARPGEWVVAPVQGVRLDPAAYAALIQRLSARFEVRFEDNLTAARFGGLREGATARVAQTSTRLKAGVP